MLVDNSNILESIAGFLDFVNQYVHFIDLMGNWNLKCVQQKVKYNCCKIMSRYNFDFVPVITGTVLNHREEKVSLFVQEETSQKFDKYYSKNKQPLRERRTGIEKRDDLFLNVDSNENVVHSALQLGNMDQVVIIAESFLTDSSCDVGINSIQNKDSPKLEALLKILYESTSAKIDQSFTKNKGLMSSKSDVFNPKPISKGLFGIKPFDVEKIERQGSSLMFQNTSLFESTRSPNFNNNPLSDAMLFSNFIKNPSSLPSSFYQPARQNISVFGHTMHSVEQLSAMIEKIKLKEESVSTPHCILKPSRINNIELQKSSILSPSIENENLPYKIPNSVLKSSMLSLSSCRRNEACPNSSEKQFVNTVNAINVPNKESKTKNNEIISANSLTEIFLSETTCNQKRRIRPKSFVELSNYANLGLGSENKMPCCQLPVVKKSTDPHEKSLVFTALNSMPEMVRISQHSPKKSMATIREIPNQIAPENVEGTNIEARGTIDSLDDVEELMEVIEEVVIGVDEVLSDGLLEEVEVYRPPTHILGTKNYFSQKETHASKNTSEDICINNNDHTFEQNNCDMNQVVYDNMKVATQSTPNVPIDLLITNRETSSSIGKSASYSQPRTADIMKETHTTSELDLNNCVRSNDEQLKTILVSQLLTVNQEQLTL
ncbi:uncharacterized protein LOC103517812 [Diaphorina citri]|uniref:Uncharacterized protein LOC103517812 n=1 Tax=Diaphorina citri TaxID=121845 RepID=A0A3Q0JAX1_DIACI|nr:uncharacterized protein LOC103517812 [Diaphorina citri]